MSMRSMRYMNPAVSVVVAAYRGVNVTPKKLARKNHSPPTDSIATDATITPVEQEDSKAKDDAATHRVLHGIGAILFGMVVTIRGPLKGLVKLEGRLDPFKSVRTAKAKKSQGLADLELLQSSPDASDSAKATTANHF
ncbi:hypothetical protein SAY87_021393 [Trapa incisa]|uniref:Uncharacterized protein n=1 Tax=Trapa incisa TaxID=236973 RepID=A0AAN7JR01_9MYRT|nr:hypothetical protein SAY87_021393 [Trapa incisa]